MNKDKKIFNEGLRVGIAFSAQRFLQGLPIQIKEELINKTIKYLISEFEFEIITEMKELPEPE